MQGLGPEQSLLFGIRKSTENRLLHSRILKKEKRNEMEAILSRGPAGGNSSMMHSWDTRSPVWPTKSGCMYFRMGRRFW